MSIEKEKIYPKATMRNLTHFKSEDYSVPLMLSEFIDNSIASWEGSKKNEDISGLEIKITLTKFSQQLNNGNIIDKYSVEIRDNAGGMNESNMRNSAELYDAGEKGDNDLNQHGIGMKSACFWLGDDVTIYSKNEFETKMNVLELNSSVRKDTDELYWDYSSQEFDNSKIKSETGTTIIIDGARRDSFIFDDKSKVNFLTSYLGWKYKYYVQKGVKIIVEFLFHGDENYIEKDSYFLIKPFVIDFWKWDIFLEYLKDKNKTNDKFDINDAEELLRSEIDKIYKNSEMNSFKSKICLKILSNEEVKFDIVRDFKLDNMEKLEIKNLGIISPLAKKKLKFSLENICGLATFHHNRGINIGPVDPKIFNGKISSLLNFSYDGKSKMSSKSTPKRLTGEAYFKNVKTEINKTTIIMNNKSEEALRIILGNIWKDFEEVLDVIVSVENKFKETKKINQKSAENVFESTLEKMCQENKKENEHVKNVEATEEGNFKYNYSNIEINGHKYNFSLIENENIEEAFICRQNDEYDFEIDYKYSHQIWFPMNEKNESKDARKTIHPLIISLSLIQHEIKDNESRQVKKPIEIFEILNSITSNWKGNR